MSDIAESAATRLWRDRAQLREQERNEAQAKARITEEKVASLTAENNRLAAENDQLRAFNDRLAAENARLRALLNPDPACAHAQIEQEMEDLKSELLSLLTHPDEKQPQAEHLAPPEPALAPAPQTMERRGFLDWLRRTQ